MLRSDSFVGNKLSDQVNKSPSPWAYAGADRVRSRSDLMNGCSPEQLVSLGAISSGPDHPHAAASKYSWCVS